MNSMAEFGVTQAATLQLAVTMPNLIDVGHCFMSTLRLKEDPTDFSSFVRERHRAPAAGPRAGRAGRRGPRAPPGGGELPPRSSPVKVESLDDRQSA